jgi:hypothetical protein
MVAEDACICMRVKSDKPFTFANGAIGWYHWLKDPLPQFKPQPKRERPEIQVRDLLNYWRDKGCMSGPKTESLARNLGVTYSSLEMIGAVWSEDYRAWAFPMRGGDGEYSGIRLRSDSGKKWAVLGSKEGVFYAFGFPNSGQLFVVEGPTDTAAAMTIGLNCVGRPGCYGGVEEIRIIVRNEKYRSVVIVADSDDVGRRGAKLLHDALSVHRVLLTLPCKDMRQFVQSGGTKTLLNSILSNLVWTQPNQRKET